MKIIGHRGAKALAPENTLASIQAALDAGVDVIEIDVHVTRDGVPVLNHDPELHPANKPALVIATSSLDEVRAAKPDIITLDVAISLVNQQVPLMIELKKNINTMPVVACLENYLTNGWLPKSFWVGSKYFRLLQKMHRSIPALELIVIEPWSGVRAHMRARKLGTRRIAMNKLWLWGGFIRAVSRSGYELYAYTVNDPAKAESWSRHGLAGICTDNPKLFIRS